MPLTLASSIAPFWWYIAPVLVSMQKPAPRAALCAMRGNRIAPNTASETAPSASLRRHGSSGSTASRKSAGQIHAELIGRISAPSAATAIITGKLHLSRRFQKRTKK